MSAPGVVRGVSLAVLLVLAAPAAAVPLPAKIAGWRALGGRKTFDRRTVYQAINGAAELYFAYGFRRLHWRDHARGKRRIAVQLYELGAPLSAFGIFAREGAGAGQRLAANQLAAARQCLAFKGRFYLKITATAGRLSASLCRTLLAAQLKGVAGATTPPAPAALLPAAGRVAGSLRFTPRSFLGLRELSRCVHASYGRRGGGKPRRHLLFLLLPTGAKAAAARWRRLARRWQKRGVDALSRKVPYRGEVVLLRTKRGIFGAADLGSARQALALLRRRLAGR